jgi:hypothetical protein
MTVIRRIKPGTQPPRSARRCRAGPGHARHDAGARKAPDRPPAGHDPHRMRAVPGQARARPWQLLCGQRSGDHASGPTTSWAPPTARSLSRAAEVGTGVLAEPSASCSHRAGGLVVPTPGGSMCPEVADVIIAGEVRPATPLLDVT